MAEPPNSSSSAAASAVAGPDIGPKLPPSVYSDPRRFLYPDYMWALLHNYWDARKKPPGPHLAYLLHYYFLIDITLHGSQLPGDFRYPAALIERNRKEGRSGPKIIKPPPIVEVLNNFMIVLPATGEFMGHEATTCNMAYDNFLPYNYKPYPKPSLGSFGKPLPETPIPNIINLFGGLLGINDAPMYTGLLYGTPGVRIPNRLITFSEADLDEPYRVPSESFRMNHFGVHELQDNYYARTDRTKEVIQRILYGWADDTGIARITLGEIQDIINDVYKGDSPNRQLILFINACDVSHETEKIPDALYTHASYRPHHHLTQPWGEAWSIKNHKWPKAPTHVPVLPHKYGESITIGSRGFRGFTPPEIAVRVGAPEGAHRSVRTLLNHYESGAARIMNEEEPHYSKVPGFEPALPEEGGDEESMIPTAAVASSASAAAQPKSGKSSGKLSGMNEEHMGGRLKKRKTYRKKRRWLRSTNRKRTGSKRASRSSNR